MKTNGQSLSTSSLVAYALPAVPVALLGLPLYIYLPAFYAEEIGLGVSLVGIILFAARFFDMLTDPLIGHYSDRYWRRKPLMFVGALVLLAGFFGLTHPSADAGSAWLLLFSVLVYTGWSALSIPYLSLNAELSPDYHDKTRLASARELATMLGVVAALMLPYAFNIAERSGDTLLLMWQTLLWLLPVMLGIMLIGIKEPAVRVSDPLSLEQTGSAIRSHNGLGHLFSAYFINNLANALPATLFLFFVERVIGAPEKTGFLLLLYFVSGMAALPFWTRLSRKTGKRRAWMLSMLLASAAFAFVPLLGQGDLDWFILICVLSGLSLGADMALPASIQSDAAQAAERSGFRLTGVLFGLWAMLTKLALALAVGIAFGILGLAGFDPAAPSPASLTVLSLLYGLLPVILKLGSILILRHYREVS